MVTNTMKPSREQYLKDFWECAAETGVGNAESVILQPPSTSRVWLCDEERQISLQLADKAVLDSDNAQRNTAVILVEDISLDWIATLGCKFNIDVAFFCEYLSGLRGPSPWKAVFGNGGSDIKRPTRLHHDVAPVISVGSHNIDGVFQLGLPVQMRSSPHRRPGRNVLDRRMENHAPFGWESATRISYCRLKWNLFKDNTAFDDFHSTNTEHHRQTSFWWTPRSP